MFKIRYLGFLRVIARSLLLAINNALVEEIVTNTSLPIGDRIVAISSIQEETAKILQP